MKNLYLLVSIILIFASSSYGQIASAGIGINLGLGQIKGNSPSLASLSGSIMVDVTTTFWDELTFRTGYHYSRKVEYFLPENSRGKYYPFLKFYSLQVVINQKMGEKLFLEEGLGIVYLNDRTFSDTNDWNAGTIFSGLFGIDFRENESGFTLGAGAEYAVAFTNNNASYIAVKIQSFYYF